MSTYQEALRFLYGLRRHGIKLGLQKPRELLRRLQEPQEGLKVLHVAGTNGKGSTCHMLFSMLRAQGLRAGLFTSPHLVSFTERIRVDGQEISPREVAELALQVKEASQGLAITFFEAAVAMAFLYFRQKGAQWAVLEVGMGGRLDATNTVERPEVCIISTVGMDHREFLGSSLQEIAFEKAGILKPGVPAVVGPQEPQALEVILRRAREVDSPLSLWGRDFGAALQRQGPEGLTLHYRGREELRDVFLPLLGAHQVRNAAQALRAGELLGLGQEAMREGLRRVQIPGRLELLRRHPEVRLDGAHNPQAAQALAEALKVLLQRKRGLILVLGLMKDKDAQGILRPLLPLAREVLLTASADERALRPQALRALAEALGHRGARVAPTVKEAVGTALELAAEDDLVLITGSFYVAGQAREALLGEPSALRGLKE
jgi:dihydrofolate synthase/folylpolyglutamate synthase